MPVYVPIGDEPASPVTLAEMKAHLRVDFDDDDSIISDKLAAALAFINGPQGINYTLAARQFHLFLPSFAALREGLYTQPVASVEAVDWRDDAGAWQGVPATDYRLVSGYPARLVLNPGKGWPSAPPAPDAVRITFTLGHASGAVPADLKAAVKMLAAHWYRNDVPVTDRAMMEVPLTVQAILAKYSSGLVA